MYHVGMYVCACARLYIYILRHGTLNIGSHCRKFSMFQSTWKMYGMDQQYYPSLGRCVAWTSHQVNLTTVGRPECDLVRAVRAAKRNYWICSKKEVYARVTIVLSGCNDRFGLSIKSLGAMRQSRKRRQHKKCVSMYGCMATYVHYFIIFQASVSPASASEATAVSSSLATTSTVQSITTIKTLRGLSFEIKIPDWPTVEASLNLVWV